VLDRTLDPSFRLWDAYGVLPVLCDPNRRGKVDACVVKYDQVKDIIRSTKDRCVWPPIVCLCSWAKDGVRR
jgi:hypothetical protein